MVPAQVPSYRLAYITVEDVVKAHKTAVQHGAKEMLEPQDFRAADSQSLATPRVPRSAS
jgi:hypothetical protein